MNAEESGWSRGARRWVFLSVPLALGVAGCNVAVAAGAGVVLIGAAIIAHDCVDHLTITVFDGRTGRRTCDATVTISGNGTEREVLPCYHAELDEGTWTVTAQYPGLVPMQSTVVVTRPRGCEPAVHTVEMTLAVPRGPMPPTPPGQPAPGAATANETGGVPAAPPPLPPAGTAPTQPPPSAPVPPSTEAPAPPPTTAPPPTATQPPPAPAAPPPPAAPTQRPAPPSAAFPPAPAEAPRTPAGPR